ncbi:unnamed protein product, partial [Mesorhabditis spiculigera]
MSIYTRILFAAVLLATVAALVEEHKEEHETEESHLRAKRQYGYGGYGWGGDYWYTGRMWGDPDRHHLVVAVLLRAVSLLDWRLVHGPAAPAQSEHIVYQSDERYYTTSGSPPRNSAI